MSKEKIIKKMYVESFRKETVSDYSFQQELIAVALSEGLSKKEASDAVSIFIYKERRSPCIRLPNMSRSVIWFVPRIPRMMSTIPRRNQLSKRCRTTRSGTRLSTVTATIRHPISSFTL